MALAGGSLSYAPVHADDHESDLTKSLTTGVALNMPQVVLGKYSEPNLLRPLCNPVELPKRL